MNNDEEELQPEEDLSLAETYRVPPFNLEKFKADLEAAGLSDPEVLLEAVKKSENIIGVGGNAIVCRIPQIDGYVLKVHSRDWLKNRELTELVAVEDQFPEMNFGQPVASIGMADVLKEQVGVPAGVPYGEVRKSRETGNAVYEIYLKTAAAMPQKSYDQLAELFVFLNENDLIFDPSKSNNILVDSEKDIFNLVDLHHKESDDQPKNSLSYIVISLLDNAYAWKVQDEELEPSLVEYRRQILDKCIKACQKAELTKVDSNDSSLSYSFQLAGIGDQWDQFVAESLDSEENLA
jgi:hypothetical protein